MKDSLTGNKAVALAVKMVKVKVVAAYPITPQSRIVETISDYIAQGQMDAEFVVSEGEHGVFGTIIGAALNGVRTFTATCSQGFLFGYENIAWIPGQRLPVVTAITNRLYAAPGGIWCDHSDTMTAKDLGWLQIYVESPQEAFDTIVQAYRIAEDKKVLLPVFVCLDGFSVSHTTEVIDIPEQDQVNAYLPVYRQDHIILDPKKPMEMLSGSLKPEGHLGLEYLRKVAMDEAIDIVQAANEEYGKKFGRRYGNGLVETYQCDDAEAVVVVMGSIAGDARKAVDDMRKEGKRVGLCRLRTYRPFPKDEIRKLVKKNRVLAVVDRNVSRGLNEGAVYTEIKSTLFNHSHETKVIGFIAGLKGNDLWDSDFRYMLNKALKVGQGLEQSEEVEWIPKVNIKLKTISETVPDKLYYSGSSSCPGCGMALAFRHLVDTLGKNMIMVRTAGCQAWTSTAPGKTCAGIPLGRAVLPGGASLAAGLSRALKTKGEKKDVEVVLFGGDGSVGDMGMLALSGAAERNEDILVVVYDNEAYANTGMQRSGATPKFARTTTTPIGVRGRGEKRSAKDLPLIVAAHKVPYVATASVSHINDLRKKIKKVKKINGFRYIHIHIPCTTSWGFPPEDSISLERLGVETCIHPLYEIENGKLTVTYAPKEKVSVKDYLMQQRRFKHMTEEEIQIMQNEVEHKWEELLKYERCGLSLFSE